MTEPLGCAIDFGTTNSSVALIYPDEVRILNVGEGSIPTSIRSILYLHRNGNRAVGESAVRQYLLTSRATTDGELDSRLISGLKGALTEQITTRSWGRDFTLADLVGDILRDLKRRAEEESGSEIHRVVLGHPVVLSDGSGPGTRGYNQAISTLQAAASYAGFEEVEFLPEPQAALSVLEGFEGSALTVDFGGGTCDIALQPDGSEGSSLKPVLRGLPIGGERFDSSIFEHKMETPLCLDGRFISQLGKEFAVPARIRAHLRHLSGALRLISEEDTATTLRDLAGYEGGDRLEMLREILYGGHAYAFYGAIEQAKIDLSGIEVATISFSRKALGIAIEEEVKRSELESWLSSDLDRICDGVTDALLEGGLDPSGVSIVMRTGGSSSIPAFIRRLESIFGAERIVEKPVYTTVVRGLALHGQALWATRVPAAVTPETETLDAPEAVSKAPEPVPVTEPPEPTPTAAEMLPVSEATILPKKKWSRLRGLFRRG